jgi:hypothetical protein
MPLSIVYLSRTSGVPDYLVRQAQAADPEEMDRVVALHLAEVVAMNADIQDPQLKFTPVDANLAGAGDGHTFIVTVVFTRVAFAGIQNTLIGESVALPLNPAANFIDPSLFVTKFALASEQESVEVATNEAIRKLLDQAAGTPGGDAVVLSNFIMMAGSSKGTRFMAGVAGLVPPPQTPPD